MHRRRPPSVAYNRSQIQACLDDMDHYRPSNELPCLPGYLTVDRGGRSGTCWDEYNEIVLDTWQAGCKGRI